jgi:hypothetical protein
MGSIGPLVCIHGGWCGGPRQGMIRIAVIGFEEIKSSQPPNTRRRPLPLIKIMREISGGVTCTITRVEAAKPGSSPDPVTETAPGNESLTNHTPIHTDLQRLGETGPLDATGSIAVLDQPRHDLARGVEIRRRPTRGVLRDWPSHRRHARGSWGVATQQP